VHPLFGTPGQKSTGHWGFGCPEGADVSGAKRSGLYEAQNEFFRGQDGNSPVGYSTQQMGIAGIAGDDSIDLVVDGAGKHEIVVAIRADGFFARDTGNEDGKRTRKVRHGAHEIIPFVIRSR